jgi:uroporphyrinogen decarboxylase
MDSRERTFLALGFEEPDRVPIDVWASEGFAAMLRRRTGADLAAFLDAHDVDLRYVEGPRYVGPPPAAGCDLWGVRRRRVEAPTPHGCETYSEVAESPLAAAQSAEDVERYPSWPSADWFDYTPVAASARAVRHAGRVAVFMGDRLNRIAQLKPAMYLRGVEQILLDFALNPEVARAVIGRVRAFYLAYAERVFAAAEGQLDLVCTGDDFGSQTGPLISPAMWTDYLGDGFRDFIACAHAHGLKVMHHTCGSVRPIIPLMVERGLDILQSLQPEAADMDLAAIKREFGTPRSRTTGSNHRPPLAFQGGISIQRTLPFGSAEDIRREVRAAVEALAPGGGYILGTAHNLQADVSLENAQTLLRAYHEFGRGPFA